MALYVQTRKGPDGTIVRGKPLPIPRQPPGRGTTWAKVFRHVAGKFRGAMARIGDGDPWISHGLCYVALRRCARRGQHENPSYVYRACQNAHVKHLARARRWSKRRRPFPASHKRAAYSPAWSEIDLRVDLADALGQLPDADAELCRLRLVEERTFEELGQTMGIDKSTAMRRFDRCLPLIRESLRDYAPWRRPTPL